MEFIEFHPLILVQSIQFFNQLPEIIIVDLYDSFLYLHIAKNQGIVKMFFTCCDKGGFPSISLRVNPHLSSLKGSSGAFFCSSSSVIKRKKHPTNKIFPIIRSLSMSPPYRNNKSAGCSFRSYAASLRRPIQYLFPSLQTQRTLLFVPLK